MTAIIIILGFVALFIMGFPVAVAIGVPSVLYVLINGFPVEMFFNRYLFALDSFTLLALPLFIFVGNLMTTAGITTRIFRFADIFVGWLPGGLAQVNILASLLFAGKSGSALADVGALGQMQVKAMTEKGFPKPFSAAISVASATVTPIFPPSIPYVVFGAVTGTSIVRLFLAGIVPGIAMVALLMIFTAFVGIKRKYPRQTRLPTVKEVIESFLPTIPALLAPVLLIGGLLLGFFTPTEAASIVVAYVIMIGFLFYRDLTLSHIWEAAVTTVKQTGAICIIITVATLFGWVMTIERIPMLFTSAMAPFINNKILLLVVINMILVFVGMFLDSNTATLIVIPIMMPTFLAAGLDPVHIGVMVVFNLMIGLLTPPLGLSVLLISNVTGVPVGQVFRAVPIFFVPLLLMLAIITFIPEVTLWIPNLVMN